MSNELTHDQMIKDGWEMTADGFWIKEGRKSYLVNVELDPINDDYYITLPDEVIQSLDLKEGDSVEWTENTDGAFVLKKIND